MGETGGQRADAKRRSEGLRPPCKMGGLTGADSAPAPLLGPNRTPEGIRGVDARPQGGLPPGRATARTQPQAGPSTPSHRHGAATAPSQPRSTSREGERHEAGTARQLTAQVSTLVGQATRAMRGARSYERNPNGSCLRGRARRDCFDSAAIERRFPRGPVWITVVSVTGRASEAWPGPVRWPAGPRPPRGPRRRARAPRPTFSKNFGGQ